MGQDCKSVKYALRGNCYETDMFHRSRIENFENSLENENEKLEKEHIKGDDRHRLTSILSVEECEKDLTS